MQLQALIVWTILAKLFCTLASPHWLLADEFPDIRSVAVDLVVPPLLEQKAAPGIRVKQQLADWKTDSVYHVLYLPNDWRGDDGSCYPVIVELAGNGGYENEYGDVSTGRPEGSNLGFGLSGGKECIWICVPYLNTGGDNLALQWWGDPPEYNPEPTLKYMRNAVEMVCRDFGGDPSRVVLCGFSRGAIAGNYLGLHDDQTSRLWRAFFAFSHYDGVRRWPFSGQDPESPETRLKRLGGRAQFVCSEGVDVVATREYLDKVVTDSNITTLATGFRNHNDAWILRPSPARDAARQWFADVLTASPSDTAE